MRRLGLALLVAFPLFAQEVRFFTDHPQIAPRLGAGVFLENNTEAPLTDVAIEVRLDAGLAFHPPAGVNSEGWTCEGENTSVLTCRIPLFESGRIDVFAFVLDSTDPSGGMRTVRATLTAREIAPPRVVDFEVTVPRVIKVTTNADFGPGTLRAAIEEANEHPLCGTPIPCTISFNANMTIAPLSPLPPIRKCNVSVAGPDFLFAKGIVLSGENATHGHGLEVRASCAEGLPGVSIRGLAIHSWPWDGIHFEAPSPTAARHEVVNCHVGTDAAGLVAKPNRSRGIVTDSPHERLWIAQSIVSGNRRSGIALFRGTSVDIVSMKIGVDINAGPLGNGASGVFSNRVPFLVGSALIAHNAHAGVAISRGTPRAFVIANSIQLNGGLPIDWGLDARTPSDDETDGVLNAPRITEASYNPLTNLTTVRGVVRLRAGAFGNVYSIEPYAALNARGDTLVRLIGNTAVQAPADGSAGDVAFAITLAGDLRGQFIALQTFAGETSLLPSMVSEISEGALVR